MLIKLEKYLLDVGVQVSIFFFPTVRLVGSLTHSLHGFSQLLDIGLWVKTSGLLHCSTVSNLKMKKKKKEKKNERRKHTTMFRAVTSVELELSRSSVGPSLSNFSRSPLSGNKVHICLFVCLRLRQVSTGGSITFST